MTNPHINQLIDQSDWLYRSGNLLLLGGFSDALARLNKSLACDVYMIRLPVQPCCIHNANVLSRTIHKSTLQTTIVAGNLETISQFRQEHAGVEQGRGQPIVFGTQAEGIG